MTDRLVQNIHGIHATVEGLARKPALKAVLVSRKRDHFCSHTIRRASFHGVEFDILPDLAALRGQASAYDICILCCHNNDEEPLLFELRAAGLASVYFAWMWDNHHHHILQIRTAMLADCLFLSHWHERHYLNHPAILPGPHMPACSRQWSSGLIAATYPAGLPVARRDGLFGGFGRYDWAAERNAFIAALMTSCPDHALGLGSVDAYVAQPEAARLALWAGHKAHIMVPIARDLSTRVFDALLTGQIPLVPSDVADLDLVVPKTLQAALPILRYEPGSVGSAKAAWQEALRRFDAEGAAGIARRHRFAAEHHGLPNRLERFAAFIRKPGHFDLAADARYQFWRNWADEPQAG